MHAVGGYVVDEHGGGTLCAYIEQGHCVYRPAQVKNMFVVEGPLSEGEWAELPANGA